MRAEHDRQWAPYFAPGAWLNCRAQEKAITRRAATVVALHIINGDELGNDNTPVDVDNVANKA